jgi:hypothetical protein
MKKNSIKMICLFANKKAIFRLNQHLLVGNHRKLKAPKLKQTYVSTNKIETNTNVLNYLKNDDIDKSNLEKKLLKLSTMFYKTGTVSSKIYFQALTLVEKHKWCDSVAALSLIKFMNRSFIDLFPVNRQSYLNYLFNELMPSLNVAYDQKHFHYYMLNTIENEFTFDSIKLVDQLSAKNIPINFSMHIYFLTNFCALNEIKIALKHLLDLIEREDIKKAKNFNQYAQTNASENELFEVLLNRLRAGKLGQSRDESYEQIASDLNTNKLLASSYLILVNPLIDYFLRMNDSVKAIKLFKLIYELNLNPTNSNNFFLTNGFITIGKLDEANKLFDQVQTTFAIKHVFAIIFQLINAKPARGSADVEKIEQLLKKAKTLLPSKLNNEDRIEFANFIQKLFYANKIDTALDFIENHLENEYNERDPIKLDKLSQQFSVVDYFCSYVVNNKVAPELIVQYASMLDKSFESTYQPHLMRMLYYSLLGRNTELSLKLFDQLKAKRIKIKAHYFLPLILKQTSELDAVLKRVCTDAIGTTNEAKSDIANSVTGIAITTTTYEKRDPAWKSDFIESLPEFKRISSLISLIRNPYMCDFTIVDLKLFLRYMRYSDEKMPKKHVKYINIMKHFEGLFTRSKLLIICTLKLLSYRIETFEDSIISIQDIYDDMTEINELIEYARPYRPIEASCLFKLNEYLYKLSRLNEKIMNGVVFDDPNHPNPITQLILNINKITKNSTYKYPLSNEKLFELNALFYKLLKSKRFKMNSDVDEFFRQNKLPFSDTNEVFAETQVG